MVVLLYGPAAPDDRPLSVEREAQFRLRFMVQMFRRCLAWCFGRSDEQAEDDASRVKSPLDEYCKACLLERSDALVDRRYPLGKYLPGDDSGFLSDVAEEAVTECAQARSTTYGVRQFVAETSDQRISLAGVELLGQFATEFQGVVRLLS